METCGWKVLQGTPGATATAPSVPAGSILNGDADVTVPIASVSFDGLTTGTPKLLVPVLTPLATLGDSVYHEVGFQFLYGRSFSGDFVAYRKRGFVVEMLWNFPQESTAMWSAGTLPIGFRPAHSFQEPAVLANSNGIVTNNTAAVNVTDSGQVSFICATSVTGGRNIGHSVWMAA